MAERKGRRRREDGPDPEPTGRRGRRRMKPDTGAPATGDTTQPRDAGADDIWGGTGRPDGPDDIWGGTGTPGGAGGAMGDTGRPSGPDGIWGGAGRPAGADAAWGGTGAPGGAGGSMGGGGWGPGGPGRGRDNGFPPEGADGAPGQAGRAAAADGAGRPAASDGAGGASRAGKGRRGGGGAGAVRVLTENRFGFLALVVTALAALYGVAYVTRPAPVKPVVAAPARVAVESVTTVCPDPAGGRVSTVTPPGGKGAGRATVAEVKAKAATLAELDRPGVLWKKDLPARSAPVKVAGTGAMAAGLEAVQTTKKTRGAARGLASVRCAEPGSSAWFVGPGPAAADVTLHLTNADAAQAVLEIMVYAGEGPVVGESGNALVLQPGEHRVVKVSDLAPSPLIMAVEVRTTTGRVAAAARAVLSGGKGTDWLPLAAAPATQVVVPGLPGGGGRRELFVTAPGESDTVVQVKALTADGFYAMKNRETVEVPAGSTVSLDLSTGVGGQPSAIVLTAPVPVVAGLMITGTGAAQDIAFSAGAAPLDLGSVLADNRTAKDVSTRLILSAPQGTARVRLQTYPDRGAPPAPVDVEIPASRTKEIKLSPPAGKSGDYSLVVLPLPGSAPVYGGQIMDERTKDGLLLTATPLARSRVWTLTRPTVESPMTVLP
ncbi:DUF5719 family protein [Sphaerisporangium sp. B11E5]|uniref:DUF5719 family protein n=1 Tax=Sphaerisporangium sp. B11E5 TaxID=3153563 RepID=UPI00325F0989